MGPCCADAVLSPAAKVPKPPMLLPPAARQDAVQQPQVMLAPKAVPTAVTTSTPASAPSRKPAAPVLSECGISLSTAPFEFPAPSEDTADITSRLPSYGTAAAGLFMHRRSSPAHAAQRQLQAVSTADPDEVSCRHTPLPARLTRQPTASAATFSSAGCAAASVGQPTYSTASLASWLASSMQGAAGDGDGAGDDSDCEDDAVSQRWGGLAPAAFRPAAAQTAACPAHQKPAPAAVASPPAGDRPAGCPVAVSGELDEGITGPGADLVPMLLQLAQGGTVSFAETEDQQQVRHARLQDGLGIRYWHN